MMQKYKSESNPDLQKKKLRLSLKQMAITSLHRNGKTENKNYTKMFPLKH